MAKRHPIKPHIKSELSVWFKEHAELVAAAGVPALIMSTEEHWWYFLDHDGLYRFDDDPTKFEIRSLKPLQRAAFMRLLLTHSEMMQTHVGHALIYLLVEAVENAYST